MKKIYSSINKIKLECQEIEVKKVDRHNRPKDTKNISAIR
jgi:hypothetical protein